MYKNHVWAIASVPRAEPSRRTPGAGCRIVLGDAREAMADIPEGSVDLCFWSPPYFVGKSYEKHLDFEGWQGLVDGAVRGCARVLRPGGFMVVNIGDILSFPDPAMPRIQADMVAGKRSPVTRADVLAAKKKMPGAGRRELAESLGCSEQTVQRRLEHNNVRGGKSACGTRVVMTGAMVAGWAQEAGLYLYDRRVWHKDPAWANSRWHSGSYRAVDEHENVLAFWKPGITEYDRGRLSAGEWSEWGSRGVWKIASVRKNGRHEAEFPQELARRVVKLFSPRGGMVLDPFVGTGTTAAAAKAEGRRWIGIDSDEGCVRMAEERVA